MTSFKLLTHFGELRQVREIASCSKLEKPRNHFILCARPCLVESYTSQDPSTRRDSFDAHAASLDSQAHADHFRSEP